MKYYGILEYIQSIMSQTLKTLVRILKKKSKENITFEYCVFVGYMVFGVVNRILFLIMHVLPLTKKKIVFCNMKGIRYGDNPMYISEILHKKKLDYEIVWLIDRRVDANIPSYIKVVQYGFWNNMRELATAKVWVDSNTKNLGTYKSKEQLYIQTWHGSYGIKKVALDRKDDLPKIDTKLYPFNSAITDIMVSNSKRTTEIYRNAFAFKNTILEVGSPRNDIFFSKNCDEISFAVKQHFGIDTEGHIALYAPTFRENYNIDFFNIDMKKLEQELSDKFGGIFYLFVRLHPQNLKEAKNIKCVDRVLNVSDYSIMQDLLVAADILITDYSSCMFDFITKPKPCFIYAPDLEEYERDRGNYFKMSELPFPLAQSNDELISNIINFDNDEYTAKVNALHDRVGLCETGNASEKVADVIIDFIENRKK